jgi:hypothetical protein
LIKDREKRAALKRGHREEIAMRSLLFAVAAFALAAPTLAQPVPAPKADNLEKLSSFRQTGTVEPPHIPQTGRRADALKRNLERVKLPPGFKIETLRNRA